ncbi:iduronate-2-sulfatase [Planctomyces sp. SCGC AG-212-M04]|nr:iduronate-2-sulfatase [Planctomyces sp. SCGC AG-212-M04]
MTNRLLFVLAVLSLLVVGPASAADAKRPNVLFLISDDLNNLLGCYGDPLAKTPNIDKLAKRGVMFEKAYCTFPLCGPSRNSFLTGLYPNSTGILRNAQVFRQSIPEQVSMPQAFRQQGYLAARIGKLYHYNVPNSIGTNGHDDPGSWEVETNPAGIDRLEEHSKIFSLIPNQFGGTLSWYASPAPDTKHTDALEADDAEWILERCAKQKDRPFFLAVGFFRPHTPYVAPKKYFDMHPEKSMPVFQGIKEDQADIPEAGLGSYKKEQDKLTDDLRRQARQAYNASISFMDAQVGHVVDALDRLGLSDNTIIVFTSDHGYHVGEHGLWQKMSIFEESARVPLLIVAPGASKGSVAKSPVSQLDLFPTLAELCGIKPPANLQGQTLVPMLKNTSVEGRGWALTQVMRGGGARRASVTTNVGSDGRQFFGYSLRTPRYRYTEWDEGNKGRELYDHDKDPKELTNLAERSENAKTVEELSAKLREAVKTTFPPSGKTPEVKEGPLWAPLLVDP